MNSEKQRLHFTGPAEDDRMTAPTSIAGFWSRIMALLADSIFMGTLGLVTGFFFFDALARLGGRGRVIGFAIAGLYFGLLNSAVGKGQTLGKRFAGVKVVDRQGEPISPGRSFIRFCVIGLPFFLNGSMVRPEITTSFIGMLMALIVFGFGGAIIYLYIFNRRSRQSLHDLIAGTYVVTARSVGEVRAPKIWNVHLAVAGMWIAAVLVVVALVIPWWTQRAPFSELLSLQKKISNMDHVEAVSVGFGKTTTAPSESKPASAATYLFAHVFWNEGSGTFEKAASQVAALILREYPAVHGRDLLVIKVSYGYDIGISHMAKSYSASEPPHAWVKN